MNEEQSFKAWCVVELFGHVTLAGYVSEQVIGGASFIRLDAPGVDGQAEFTKLLGAGAIYSITPTSEAVARSAIERIRAKPVNVYYLPEPKTQVVNDDEVEDGPSLIDQKFAVDHIATLLWIRNEAPAGWCAELDRRLKAALEVVDEWMDYCPHCHAENINTPHSAGTNGDVCLECGHVHEQETPF